MPKKSTHFPPGRYLQATPCTGHTNRTARWQVLCRKSWCNAPLEIWTSSIRSSVGHLRLATWIFLLKSVWATNRKGCHRLNPRSDNLSFQHGDRKAHPLCFGGTVSQGKTPPALFLRSEPQHRENPSCATSWERCSYECYRYAKNLLGLHDSSEAASLRMAAAERPLGREKATSALLTCHTSHCGHQ